MTEDEFYAWSASDLPTLNVANGSVLRCQDVGDGTGSRDGYRIYRVLYKTTTSVTQNGVKSDLALPASGQVYVPKAELADGLVRPVLSNTHGLSGLLVSCGLSRSLRIDSMKAMTDLTTRLPQAPITLPDYPRPSSTRTSGGIRS